MSELSIVMLCSAVLFSAVFAIVCWKLGKNISRKKQLYLDCLRWYKKSPKDVTPKDVDDCRELLEKKIEK